MPPGKLGPPGALLLLPRANKSSCDGWNVKGEASKRCGAPLIFQPCSDNPIGGSNKTQDMWYKKCYHSIR